MICTVENCDKPVRATKLCSGHYMRVWRYGSVHGGTNGMTHGMTETREYWIWAQMKNRCLNPNDRGYARYGGRGIKVCDKWLQFENFITDMGFRPSTKHSIERINNDGNYEPSNCQWATRDLQMHNRSAYNKTGIKGIHLIKSGSYHVIISHKGIVLQKVVKTLDEAKNIYKLFEEKLYVKS